MGLRHNTLLRLIHNLDMGGGVGLPEGIVDGADGGFVVSAGFLEAGKIVGPQEILAGPVHGLKVQMGVAALPGIGAEKRVFLPMDEVGIFPASGAEAGV